MLAVAVVLAVLFTISGVSRRTREFGTLKAIGWSNGRVVGQVAGESVVQGLIGGAIGLVVGPRRRLGDQRHPADDLGSADRPAGSGRADPAAGDPASSRSSRRRTTDIVLTAPVTAWVIVAAVGLAIAGGLIAGAFGGWRAARLSPAEALRSVG